MPLKVRRYEGKYFPVQCLLLPSLNWRFPPGNIFYPFVIPVALSSYNELMGPAQVYLDGVRWGGGGTVSLVRGRSLYLRGAPYLRGLVGPSPPPTPSLFTLSPPSLPEPFPSLFRKCLPPPSQLGGGGVVCIYSLADDFWCELCRQVSVRFFCSFMQIQLLELYDVVHGISDIRVYSKCFSVFCLFST